MQVPPATISPVCGRVRDTHRMTVPQGRSRLPCADVERASRHWQPRQGVRQVEAAARARSSALPASWLLCPGTTSQLLPTSPWL